MQKAGWREYGEKNRTATDKIKRVLDIYTRLTNGNIIDKSALAVEYNVNERSIQRDIEDIRQYLDRKRTEGVFQSVVYDRFEKGYRLEQIYNEKFTNPEILAVCKILLDSRAFTREEMDEILDKLISISVPATNQKIIEKLIGNEKFHYIEPGHKKVFMDKLWDIGMAIHNQKYIEIDYQGSQSSDVKTRKLKPAALMFSEYYFYLAAFIEDDALKEYFNNIHETYPTIYRLDRIVRLRVLDESFRVLYSNRFEEGEFRKRVQFMYGGKLRKIKFKYTGYSAESVLDRLPTAVILEQKKHEDGKRTIYTISAEVFGDGVDMWLRSQGDKIIVLE